MPSFLARAMAAVELRALALSSPSVNTIKTFLPARVATSWAASERASKSAVWPSSRVRKIARLAACLSVVNSWRTVKRVDQLDDGVFYPRQGFRHAASGVEQNAAGKTLSAGLKIGDSLGLPIIENLKIVARQAIHISAPMVVHGRVHFHEVNLHLDRTRNLSSRAGAGHQHKR